MGKKISLNKKFISKEERKEKTLIWFHCQYCAGRYQAYEYNGEICPKCEEKERKKQITT